MENIKHLFDILYLPQINIKDILEISFISYIIYMFFKGIQKTRLYILIKAIIILCIFYFGAYLLSMNVILVIVQSLMIVFVFSMVIVFQPEIKRALENIGVRSTHKTFSIKNIFSKKYDNLRFTDNTIDSIVKSCFEMSKVKTGALIVIEGSIPLNEYIATGIKIDGKISSALILNTFEKNTPLHDGAVIIKDNKISAATCYLPLSDDNNISKSMGTRHRAAIGVSDISDCLVIIVSEETGKISYVQKGKVTIVKSEDKLISALKKFQINEEMILKKKKIKPFKNWGTKLFAISLGLFLWFIITNISDPITSTTIRNIPIEVINENAVIDVKMSFEISSGNIVSVIVKDKRSIVEKISKSDISVVADMSKMSYVYSVPLSVSLLKYPTTQVNFVNESSISVILDDIIDKELPLTFNKIGNSSSGYFVHKLVSDMDSVVITGPQRLIDTIDKIQLTIDISGAKENFNKTVSPNVYDKNGSLIDPNKYTLSKNNFNVKAELYKTKNIKLSVNLKQPEESILQNIEIIDVIPKRILIAGEDDTIKEIENLDIEIGSNIDTAAISGEYFIKEINIEDYLPNDIYSADSNSKISIVIRSIPIITKVLEFTNEDIAVINNLGQEIEFISDDYMVEITGLETILENLDIKTLNPQITIDNLETEMKVTFDEIASVSYENDVIVNIIPK